MADDDTVDMAATALDLAESWGTVDLDPSQIQELRRALADAYRQGRGPRTSHCWGLRAGEWWLVEYANGEPHTAYHQLHGRTPATRESFTHWSPNADGPRPSDCERGADARDVLEAAHDLRLRGCEGESAYEVMVDAARLLLESQALAVESQTVFGRQIMDANNVEAMLKGDLVKCAQRIAAMELQLEDHQRAAAGLAELGCRGENVAATMVAAGEKIEQATVAEAEGNRVIDRLSRRADSAESELARERETSAERLREIDRLLKGADTASDAEILRLGTVLVRAEETSETRLQEIDLLNSRLKEAHSALDQVSTIALNAGSS